jgi:Flp pilus assembly protein TadB
MWSSFLVAMGGVMAIGLIGFAFAWHAINAVHAAARARKAEAQQLELSLDRIEAELRKVRLLAHSPR